MEAQELLTQTSEMPEAIEKEAEAPILTVLLQQRDEARRTAEALRAELEASRRARYLTAQGVPAEEADWTAAWLGSQVTENLSFEDAAARYLQGRNARPAARVDLTAPVGGGGETVSPGDAMNRLLREARRR